jgi:hypothetical protein
MVFRWIISFTKRQPTIAQISENVTPNGQLPQTKKQENFIRPWLDFSPDRSSLIASQPKFSILSSFNSAINAFIVVTRAIYPYLLGRKAITTTSPNLQQEHFPNVVIDDKLPPELQSTCVLGIHGWFPIKFIQKVVGEPTGTSLKFCEAMTSAFCSWTFKHYGVEIRPECITQIALEYEGCVEERADRLFHQLVGNKPLTKDKKSDPQIQMDWHTKLSNSKTILLTTHSQGCPTSVLLVDKLVSAGVLDPSRQNILILALAGISHGPFPTHRNSLYVKYVEADAARQLFEFNSFKSGISLEYYRACERLLAFSGNIKISLVASWHDQVVPLYSSLFHSLSSSKVLRSVFVDSRVPNDNILVRLACLSASLRNKGFSDYDLCVHLSDLVAGSLLFGAGAHSLIYEDPNVYELSLNFLFSCDSPYVAKQNSLVSVRDFVAPDKSNPYYLTWCIHSLLSDSSIPSDLNFELISILKDLDSIDDPNSKIVNSKLRRDLKYRLEPCLKNIRDLSNSNKIQPML